MKFRRVIVFPSTGYHWYRIEGRAFCGNWDIWIDERERVTYWWTSTFTLIGARWLIRRYESKIRNRS